MGWLKKLLGTSEEHGDRSPVAPQPSAPATGEPISPERLNEFIAGTAGRIVADPRWAEERDDLGVSIVGMLLYGFALGSGADRADAGAAVAAALTSRVGSAAKWTGGLVEEAHLSAANPDHHSGHHSLILVGRSYGGKDAAAIVENVFANIRSFRSEATMVPVFLTPLILLLTAAERRKGSPLTEQEVLNIRDRAQCMLMTRSQADAFYATVDAAAPVALLDPERIWEEWQEVRDEVEW